MKNLVYFSIIFLVLSSCGNNKNKEAKTDFTKKEVETTIKEMNKLLQNINYLFISPAEIMETINKGNIEYNSELTNNINNKNKYNSSSSAYNNLGIYLADMVYCSFMGQPNEAGKYLETVREMGTDLRAIPPSMDKIIKESEKHLSKTDTLINITNKCFFDAIDEMEDKNMHKAVSLMISGAYIEILYLSCNSVANYSKDNPVIQKIAEQRYAFENLKNYTKVFQHNIVVKETYADLLSISKSFEGFDVENSDTKVEQQNDGTFMVMGGEEISVCKDAFNNLKSTINKVRGRMVDL